MKKVLSSSRNMAHALDLKPQKEKEKWLIDTCVYGGKGCKCKEAKFACRGGLGCAYYKNNKEFRLSKKGNVVKKYDLGNSNI